MLVASTVEAYDNAFGHTNSFIRSLSANADNLKNWLHWWHNCRHNIFRAFTGYQYPRSNLAEVIYASYEQRDQKGLSILESAGFDARDSLLLESELSQFPLLDQPAPAKGSNMISIKNNFLKDKEKLLQKWDLTSFRLVSSCQVTVNGKTNRLWVVIMHRKKIEDTGCMFQKRLNSALGMKSSIKVCKQKIINAFKRELTIGSNGKKNYKVVLTSTSSCSCPDYERSR